jgi:hypothetical protein
MKLLVITVACVLALSAAIACGGPSDEEVEAKAYEIVGRATPLMLAAAFNFEPECQRIVESFEPGAALDEDSRDEMSNSEAMAELEKMEKELDDFEADLREAECIDG